MHRIIHIDWSCYCIMDVDTLSVWMMACGVGRTLVFLDSLVLSSQWFSMEHFGWLHFGMGMRGVRMWVCFA